MALVRIDTPENIDENKAKKISSITNNLMVSILSIPPQENYVILQRHDVNFLLHHPEETSTDTLKKIIFIQITLNQGRTEELKTMSLEALQKNLVVNVRGYTAIIRHQCHRSKELNCE